jgi:aminoglycoside phosphotransferase (APT) family kinase protein
VRALPAINDTFAAVFNTNISSTKGYGHIDFKTGNGPHASWRETLLAQLDNMPLEQLRQNATNIGVDPELIQPFIDQYTSNLEYAPEERQLSHGDLGFDNILIENNRVTAIIDWASVGYAEWMYDYAKFDFWWPGRYAPPKTFGEQYGLNTDHLEQRRALYLARSALSTIQWADSFGNVQIAEWLRTHVKDRLVT